MGALLLLIVCATFTANLAARRSKGGSLERERLGQVLAVLAFAVLAVPLVYRLLLSLFGARPAGAALSLAVTLLGLSVLYVAAEQCAKALVQTHPSVLQWLAPGFAAWHALSSPLARLVSPRGAEGAATRLRSDADLHAGDFDENNLDENERKLLHNVFAFSELVAHEMMAPRPDVVWISTEHDLEQVLARVVASGHTRFPLCEGSPDRVIGYLHAKDLAFLRDNSSEHVDLRGLARPVAFVPETARAITLLRRFQEERSHLAVVVDEFGGMAGVLALEDLLEELVGDIRDEFDAEEPEIQTLASGELLVDGGMRLEELAALLDFGEAEEETVGGYIFGRLARVVRPGDQVRLEGATLRVEDMSGLRVTRVRIIPEAGAAGEALEPGSHASAAGPLELSRRS